MCTNNQKPCPHCGRMIKMYRNPVPTVDIIIEKNDELLLIERKNPPHGWAIPGGFVDYGEKVESAAIREALEETGLRVELKHLLGIYSDPQRDPRQHTVSTVFVASISGSTEPEAADDALSVKWFTEETAPETMAFDHRRILDDYFRYKNIR